MSNKNFVELKNIKKRFGKNTVIEDFNLSVDKGEMITLLGPSGCGKTTILRQIAGLEKPTSGSIYIDGEDVTNLSIQQRDVCMVFQSYALFPHMSIGENIGYGLKMTGIEKEERDERIEDALKLVDLAGFSERFVDQISGGQQQRVALARALILQPKVLLFDEPLSNLDTNLRRSMRETIRNLQQRFEITSFYVTHDQSEAFAVSDRVLVMRKGVIVQVDSPRQLYRRPISSFMANFMGDANIFPGSYEEGKVVIFGYQIDCKNEIEPKTKQCIVGVRPEAIELVDKGEECQKCRVETVAYMGPQFEVSVNWHNQTLLLQVNAILFEPKIGDEFYIQIHPKGMFLLDEKDVKGGTPTQ